MTRIHAIDPPDALTAALERARNHVQAFMLVADGVADPELRQLWVIEANAIRIALQHLTCEHAACMRAGTRLGDDGGLFCPDHVEGR